MKSVDIIQGYEYPLHTSARGGERGNGSERRKEEGEKLEQHQQRQSRCGTKLPLLSLLFLQLRPLLYTSPFLEVNQATRCCQNNLGSSIWGVIGKGGRRPPPPPPHHNIGLGYRMGSVIGSNDKFQQSVDCALTEK